MDGELVLSGYKMDEPIHINLQSVSILVPQNDFRTVTIVFDFIQRYFDKRRFSNRYQLNSLRINNTECRDDEFQVLYIRPYIDTTDLFKLAKKSLLGQVAETVYSNISIEEKGNCFRLLHDTLLDPINTLLKNYKLTCECTPADFWTLSKIIDLVSYDEDLYSSFDERSQYDLKVMLIDLFAKVVGKKKKLLLLELPEYGLSNTEYESLMELINNQRERIHASLIYTQNDNIIKIFNSPLQYHIVKQNYIWGMEDYDEMELYIHGYYNDGHINFALGDEEFLYSIFNKAQFETEYKDLSVQFFSR